MSDPHHIAWSVSGLTKRYPGKTTPVNDNLTFEVQRGEIFGVLGDNGAGKSTLVRQMVGLLKKTSGAIRLFGEPIEKNATRVGLLVGYMPQQSDALNRLTVGEALFFTSHLRGLNRGDSARERDRLLDVWGLGRVRDTDSATLSGGQRRLLRLAVAMAATPPVLVLDEPTNDLDPIRRRMVWEILQSVKAEHGSTILFITHDAIEAEKAIERVAIMHEGRFVAMGRPSDLKKNMQGGLRVEIQFGQEPAAPGAGLTFERRDAGCWVIRGEWRDVVGWLGQLDPLGLHAVRVHTPTLEDLYIHYVPAA